MEKAVGRWIARRLYYRKPSAPPIENVVAEALESRLLLSAALSPQVMASDGFTPIKWHGHSTYAHDERWLLRIDGIHGSADRQLRLINRKLRKAAVPAVATESLGADGLVLLTGQNAATYKAVLKAVRKIPAFSYLEPDLLVRIADTTPNDPNFPSQWFLHNTGQSGGTPGVDIDAPAAWDISQSDPSVVIGVIDTGVDYNHPDLAANIWTNPGEVPGDGIDNDEDGFIDDVHGWNFADSNNDPIDPNGHGTHIAGVIAAATNNNTGVAGINWNGRILPIRFIAANGFGETSTAVAAINYATMLRQRGVNIRVTNNSWGSSSYSSAIYEAIQANGAAGMIFVAAAGNGGSDGIGDNDDITPFYPASFDAPNIISVASTDKNDNRASYSNFGINSVDIGAPGSDIFSTFPNSNYGSISGTSMATSVASGVVALAFSVAPTSTSYQTVRDAVLNGGDPIPSMAGIVASNKRLNALGALLQLPMQVLSVTPAPGAVVSSPPTDFIVALSHPYNSIPAGSALTVNGVPADLVIPGGTRTLTFHFNASPVTTQGLQTISVAASAISRTIDAAPIQSFISSFRYDALPMQVISTTPASGATVAPPLTVLTVQTNEAVAPGSISTSSLVISQGSVIAALALDATTVQFTLSGVTGQGALAFSVPAGALTDAFGNPSVAYSGSIELDVTATAFPTPLISVLPLGSLVYPSPLAGVIDFPSDSDSFTLNLNAGQALSILVAPGSSLQPSVTVQAPDNSILGTAASTSPGGAALLENMAITVAGVYTITVSGDAATTGSYTLEAALNAAVEQETYVAGDDDSIPQAQSLDPSITALPAGGRRGAVLGRTDLPAGILPAELEPNDSQQTANSAALNFLPTVTNLYQIDLSGGIGAPGDQDYFSLGTLNVGDVLTVALYGADTTGTLPNPVIVLLRGSSANPVIVTDDDNSGTGNDALLFRIPITQTTSYSLIAMDANSGTGSYHMGVYLEDTGSAPATGGAQTTEIEPNGTPASATNVSTSWRRVQYVSTSAGTLTGGDHDVFAYSFTAGDVVSFYVQAVSNFRPQLVFRNQVGNLLTREDGTSVGPGNDAPVYAFTIPVTGTYYLDISPFSGTGQYKVSANLSTTTPPPVPAPVPDYYALSLGDGDKLTLALARSQAGSISLQLQDALGTTLASGIGGLANLDQFVNSFPITSAGTYFIRISGDRNLDYTLVALVDSAFDAEPNNGFATAQDISSTGRVLGYSGDDDWYQFAVTAGETFQVRTFTPGDGGGQFANALNPAIDLYDPNGALLVSDDNSAPDARNSLLTRTAQVTGNYRVLVHAASGAGEYDLRVTNFNTGIQGTSGNDGNYIRLNGGSVEVFQNSLAAGPPTWSIPLASLSALRFLGGAGDDRLTVDFSGGNPIPSGGIAFDGGNGSDTLGLLGTPSADTFTVGSAQVLFSTSPITPTGVEQFELDAAGGGDQVTVQNSATLTFTATQHLAALTIQNSARVNMAPGGDKILVTDSLAMDPATRLDLADEDLLVSAASPADIRALILSGYNQGAWNGAGIFSSAISPFTHALGYAAGNDSHLSLPGGLFDGQAVPAGSVLVKFTYVADANLDGSVDGSDVSVWAQNFTGALGPNPANPRVWSQGDWNYDGSVDGSDVALWAQRFTGALGSGGL